MTPFIAAAAYIIGVFLFLVYWSRLKRSGRELPELATSKSPRAGETAEGTTGKE